MIIGVPTEIKNNERRVAITPAGVRELTRRGHRVVIESGAGSGSSIADATYRASGAEIMTVHRVWDEAELILKVKEPVLEEYPLLRRDQSLFTYLHLAANEPLALALLQAGTTSLAYETVQLDTQLPLLAPMSEIAGRLAVYAGIYHLQSSQGGRGVLASGAPGVAPAKVVVIGGGAAGENAARQAVGIGADVTVLDLSVPRLRELDRIFEGRVNTLASSGWAIEKALLEADLVIGAVLVPGARAPKLVPRDLVAAMRAGSVLVDIAIDQGGCFEDSHPTTHDQPVYPIEKSLFYCVANMPGAVPVTSTAALTNVTLPYVVAIADKGWRRAVKTDPSLGLGLTTVAGHLVNADVASAFPALSSITQDEAVAA